MASNGLLEFQGTNKATFVGANSNIVLDTVTSSLGIGVDVDGPTSNLHVVGNAYVSTELTVGGDVTVDSTTFHVDTTENRVGVGTTNPGAKLDVNGGVILTGGVHGSRPTNDGGVLANAEIRGGPGVGSAGFLRLAAGGYNNGSASDATSKSFIDLCGYSGTSDFDRNISFHTLNQERMRINVSGNVGIGTDSPGHKIDVLTYTANDGIRIQGGSKFALLTSNLSVASYNGLVSAGDSGIIFSTDNNPYSDSGTNGFVIAPWTTLHSGGLKISETGNVGIGTTSPTQRLDVNGVIKSNVPSWHMYNTNTIHTGTLNFTTNKLTPQNCSVSLSTGRVTITVAGRYCVSFHAMTETSVASGTGCQIKIMKSGVDYVRNYHVQPAVGVTAGPTATSSIAATGGLTAIMYLAVDDYVEVNTNFLVHFNLGATFSGFMIG